jgi:hypothetical protein
MATKDDFDADQWKLIVEGPMTAGMIMITASSGGTFRETWALAHAYADARQKLKDSRLLDQIVAEKPQFDRHRYGSNDELWHEGMEQIGKAGALLREKAPDDAAAYTDFVLEAATRVAAAHKEDGQEVSPPEQKALDDIKARLEA